MNIFDYAVFTSLLHALATLISTSVAVALVLTVVAHFSNRSKDDAWLKYMVLATSVTLLGGVAGYAGGLSRIGVVGEIIPAALTLVGGVVVYLFGVKNSRGAVVSILVAGFALGLFVNYAIGAKLRDVGDRSRLSIEICTKLFANPELYKDENALKRATASMGPMCGPSFLDLYPDDTSVQ